MRFAAETRNGTQIRIEETAAGKHVLMIVKDGNKAKKIATFTGICGTDAFIEFLKEVVE